MHKGKPAFTCRAPLTTFAFATNFLYCNPQTKYPCQGGTVTRCMGQLPEHFILDAFALLPG